MGILFIKNNKLNLLGFHLEKSYIEGIYASTPQNKKRGIDGTPYKKDINKKENDDKNRETINRKISRKSKVKRRVKKFHQSIRNSSEETTNRGEKDRKRVNGSNSKFSFNKKKQINPSSSIGKDNKIPFKTEINNKIKEINSLLKGKDIKYSKQKFEAVSYDKFKLAMENNYDNLNYKLAVDIPSEEYLRDNKCKCILSENKDSGIAIKEDGDIISLFSSGGGNATNLLLYAISLGGNKLDCYDFPNKSLVDLYNKFGFIPFKKLKFNELYASEDWLRNNYPKADVVAMMLNDFSIYNIINNMGKYPKINHENIPYQEDESYDNMLKDRDIILKNKKFN